jgi:hypothetical protein
VPRRIIKVHRYGNKSAIDPEPLFCEIRLQCQSDLAPDGEFYVQVLQGSVNQMRVVAEGMREDIRAALTLFEHKVDDLLAFKPYLLLEESADPAAMSLYLKGCQSAAPSNTSPAYKCDWSKAGTRLVCG